MMVTLAPRAPRAMRATRVMADVHMAWGVSIGGPQHHLGTSRQRLRCRRSSCQRLQITAGIVGSNDAGSKRRWHRVAPCQKAMEVPLPLAPSILYVHAHRSDASLHRIDETLY